MRVKMWSRQSADFLKKLPHKSRNLYLQTAESEDSAGFTSTCTVQEFILILHVFADE